MLEEGKRQSVERDNSCWRRWVQTQPTISTSGIAARSKIAKQSSGSVRRSNPHAASVSIQTRRAGGACEGWAVKERGGTDSRPVRQLGTGIANEARRQTATTASPPIIQRIKRRKARDGMRLRPSAPTD